MYHCLARVLQLAFRLPRHPIWFRRRRIDYWHLDVGSMVSKAVSPWQDSFSIFEERSY